MTRHRVFPLIAVFVVLMGITAVGVPAGERWPSSELLLPCFEVRLHEADGIPAPTSYLAVVNSAPVMTPIEVVITSNWGIEIEALTTQFLLDPHQVQVIDLGAWIRYGHLPGRQLSPEELEHVQAALCGEVSPLDALFYSTEIDPFRPRRAVGSVIVRALDKGAPDVLFGDLFLFDVEQDFAEGEVLANLDPHLDIGPLDDDDLCQLHALRFLEGGVFNGTEFMIWNPQVAAPSADAEFPADKVRSILTAYNEAGEHLATLELDLLPMEMVRVADLGLPGKFGWLKVDTLEVDAAVEVRYHAADGLGQHAIAMEAHCLPREGGAAIDIEKSTNGFDADRPTGPRVRPGDDVEWEYVVTNVGDVPLTHVEVTDSDPGVVPQCEDDELEPGESMICTAEGVAEHCQYGNIGSVTALGPAGEVVEDDDPSHYFAEGRGAVEIEKSTNGHDADTPPGPSIAEGATVLWTYEITNVGEVELVNLTLEDDKLGLIALPDNRLAAGDTMTVEVEGVAQIGQYRNLARVSGHTECGMPTRDQDPSHYFGRVPGIDIEKATNGEDADEEPGPYIQVGHDVYWTYVVTNNGGVTLHGVTVTDSEGVAVGCPKSVLVPGETMTCHAQGSAIEGQYGNVGTATGHPAEGDPVSADDPSHYYGGSAGIHLEKATNGEDADDPTGPFVLVGDTVLWTFVVTNTGNVTLSNVSVTDTPMMGGGAAADRDFVVGCPKTVLEPGESMTCTAEGVAVAGQYENLGTATGEPPIGPPAIDTDPSHYFGVLPGIDVEKATNGEDADETTGPFIPLGGAVSWTYVVTNTGNVTLTDVTVTDDMEAGVECPKDTLAPGESMVCTASGTATAGQYGNVADAVGTPPIGPTVSDSDPSHYFGEDPQIDVEKATNGHDADDPTGPAIPVGSAVTWTYVVTNTGNVPLYDVTVEDDKLAGTVCAFASLAVGESRSCEAHGTMAPGQYVNLATATGETETGLTCGDEDPSHCIGDCGRPSIDLEKHTNGIDADTSAEAPMIRIGHPILWEFIVTNTGDMPLTGIAVSDDKLGAIACPGTSLQPGEQMICAVSGFAAKCKVHKNVGDVVATAPCDEMVTDSDPSHYKTDPGIRDQGCTPGYWKNHTDSWVETGYSTGQTVASVFPSAAAYAGVGDATLLEALSFGGGPGLDGMARVLVRAAVAAILNAAHPDVSYPATVFEIVVSVDGALASGDRDLMEMVKNGLDQANNRGCPLD